MSISENDFIVDDGTSFSVVSIDSNAALKALIELVKGEEWDGETIKSNAATIATNNSQVNKIRFTDNALLNGFIKELYFIGVSVPLEIFRINKASSNRYYVSFAKVSDQSTVAIYNNSTRQDGVLTIPTANGSGVSGYMIVDWDIFEDGYANDFHAELNDIYSQLAFNPQIALYLKSIEIDKTQYRFNVTEDLSINKFIKDLYIESPNIFLTDEFYIYNLEKNRSSDGKCNLMIRRQSDGYIVFNQLFDEPEHREFQYFENDTDTKIHGYFDWSFLPDGYSQTSVNIPLNINIQSKGYAGAVGGRLLTMDTLKNGVKFNRISTAEFNQELGGQRRTDVISASGVEYIYFKNNYFGGNIYFYDKEPTDVSDLDDYISIVTKRSSQTGTEVDSYCKVPSKAKSFMVRTQDAENSELIYTTRNDYDVDRNNRILERRICVSAIDEKVRTSEPNMKIAANGKCHMCYLAADDYSGPDPYGFLYYSKFNIKTPWNAEHFQIIDVGETINGKVVAGQGASSVQILSSGSIRFNFNARIQIGGVDEDSRIWYRDISSDGILVNDISPCTMGYSALSGLPISISECETFITSIGLTPIGVSENIYFNRDFKEYDGKLWGLITTNTLQPILAYSADELKTFTLVGAIDFACAFEAEIAFVGSEIHSIIRGTDGNTYFTKSTDLGETWITPVEITDSGNSKPQIIDYKGGTLMTFDGDGGLTDLCGVDLPNSKTVRRRIIPFLYGSDGDVVNYDILLILANRYGLNYHSLQKHNDDIYLAYSSDEIFYNTDDSGKGQIYLIPLGDMYNEDFAADFI